MLARQAVGMDTAKKTVVRIWGEISFKTPRFLLHVHASVTKKVTEDVSEQFYEGNPLFLFAASLQERINFEITDES